MTADNWRVTAPSTKLSATVPRVPTPACNAQEGPE
jgi:hypothetical protein